MHVSVRLGLFAGGGLGASSLGMHPPVQPVGGDSEGQGLGGAAARAGREHARTAERSPER